MKTTTKIALKYTGTGILSYLTALIIISGLFQRTTSIKGTGAIAIAVFISQIVLAVQEAYKKGQEEAHTNHPEHPETLKTNS